jgi:hypothetical protein
LIANPALLSHSITSASRRGMNLSAMAVSKALYRINASGYYIEANKFDKVYNRELKALRKKN